MSAPARTTTDDYSGSIWAVAFAHPVERAALHSQLGAPTDTVIDPSRTASGEEDWWVYDSDSRTVALCFRAVSQDVIVHVRPVDPERIDAACQLLRSWPIELLAEPSRRPWGFESG